MHDDNTKSPLLSSLLIGSRGCTVLFQSQPLTKQLRELEAAGVIERKVFPEVPPKVEYALTELGRALDPVLQTLKMWGIDYLFMWLEQNENAPNTALNRTRQKRRTG